MKIAFLVVKNLGRGGGIEKYTLELGRRLAANGHEITVFSMPNYGSTDALPPGMRVFQAPALRRPSLEKLSAALTASWKIARSAEAYDIVHFHSIAAGAVGWLVKNRARATVLQLHGIEWQRARWGLVGKGVLRALDRIALRSHDAYTAVSRTQVEFYRRRAGVEVTYIPTGADTQRPTSTGSCRKLGLEPDRYVLFAARLVPEKGAHYLLTAFRGLSTDMKLVIAGDARGERQYMKHLRALAEGDSRIVFTGMLDAESMDAAFRGAVVYVQPSEMEGLSIALLEAMGHGRCCLVSDIPENVEAIADAGFTFRSRDPSSLRNALMTLLTQADLRAEYGGRAQARVRTHYSWDAIANDFERLYSKTLEAACKPTPK